MKKAKRQYSIQEKALVSLDICAKDAEKAVNRGDVLVVIDVLRCGSTIVTALMNGAKEVIPTKTIREAQALHKKHPEFLLAGERKGRRPKGFDFVKEKHVILTTTNGTRAICLSKKARWALIGAFFNAEAVAKTAFKIAEKERIGISFVLSGTRGRFSLEDFLCAGAILENLSADKIECSDAALVASLTFQQSRGQLTEAVQRGSHARYLKDIGHEEDVKLCCQLNAYPVVPIYEAESIVLLSLDGESTFC